MSGKVAKRLVGPSHLGAAAATVYTVPTNRRGIVRHIHIQNGDTSSRALTISIGVDGASKRLFDAYAIGAGAVLDHYCYYVLEAAEVIQAFADVADKVVIVVDGDEVVLA